MVRGKAVNDVQVLPESLHVLAGSQHGSYLRSSKADLGHVVFTQEQVVRCHLARDLDTLLLGGADDQNLIKLEIRSTSYKSKHIVLTVFTKYKREIFK